MITKTKQKETMYVHNVHSLSRSARYSVSRGRSHALFYL